MYTLHNEVMPSDMQAALLADFGVISKRRVGETEPEAESVINAKEWLGGTVAAIRKDRRKRVIHIRSLLGESGRNGFTDSTDVHTDTSDNLYMGVTKYLLVVANTRRNGTLFFQDRSLIGRHTDELFHSVCGKLVLNAECEEIVYAQADVGQVCSFTVTDQLHAAAPLYDGDQKLLLHVQG